MYTRVLDFGSKCMAMLHIVQHNYSKAHALQIKFHRESELCSLAQFARTTLRIHGRQTQRPAARDVRSRHLPGRARN